MAEFLNFAEISQKVSFKDLFSWLNVPFTETEKELKGDGFVVSIEKNLYTNPKNKEERGSVINYLSNLMDINLRDAASEINKVFLSNKPKQSVIANVEKELPNPTLHYDEQLMTYNIDKELAKQYEIGRVKEPSIARGHIALKVCNPDDSVVGYTWYKPDGSLHFPKNFKRPVWNLNRLKEAEFIFVTTDPFDALKIISMGFPHTTSLLGSSMTDDQLNQLINHEYLQGITLIHKDPMNIVQRVAKHLYIRYFVPSKPIREMDSPQFAQFIHNPQ